MLIKYIRRIIRRKIAIIGRLPRIFALSIYRIGLGKQYKENKQRYTTLTKWLVASGMVDPGDTRKSRQKFTGKKLNVEQRR